MALFGEVMESLGEGDSLDEVGHGELWSFIIGPHFLFILYFLTADALWSADLQLLPALPFLKPCLLHHDGMTLHHFFPTLLWSEPFVTVRGQITSACMLES